MFTKLIVKFVVRAAVTVSVVAGIAVALATMAKPGPAKPPAQALTAADQSVANNGGRIEPAPRKKTTAPKTGRAPIHSNVALPPSTESPPCNCTGPTPGLDSLANAIRVRTSSVTTIVLVPAQLPVTVPTEISVLFDSRTRITQNYDPATGNRIKFDFPVGDGKAFQSRVDISLLERGAKLVPFSYHPTVTIEPHFDASLSTLRFVLPDDCDPVGDSEAFIYFNDDRGTVTKRFDLSAGGERTITEFSRFLTDVTVADGYKAPVFFFDERDSFITAFPDFGFKGRPISTTPLLPATTRSFDFTLFGAAQDQSCKGEFRYTLTVTLRTYNLL